MTPSSGPHSGWSFTVHGDNEPPMPLDHATVTMLKKLGSSQDSGDTPRPLHTIVDSTPDSDTFITIEAPDGVPEADLEAVAAGMVAAIHQALTTHTASTATTHADTTHADTHPPAAEATTSQDN